MEAPLSSVQVVEDCSDCTDLLPSVGLFLKPYAKLSITVTLPKLSTGQSISSNEIIEKLRLAIKPLKFTSIRVTKSNPEFVRFEAEINNKNKVESVIQKIDLKGIRLNNCSGLLKIRAAEGKINFPTRHEWDAFFRDAKHMNEMKPGERPDTVVLKGLPNRWFSHNKAASNVRPSDQLMSRILSQFGDIRHIDIPTNDPLRLKMTPTISGLNQSSLSTKDLLFTCFVQFRDYIGFDKCMHELQGKKLVYQEDGKAWSCDIEVDYDRTKHLTDYCIKKRHEETEKLLALDRAMQEKLKKQQEREEEERRLEEEQESALLFKQQELKGLKMKEKAERREKREQMRRNKRMKKMGDGDEDEIADKIANEEKKLMMAQRRLESIRLLDELFDRIKVVRMRGGPKVSEVTPNDDPTMAKEEKLKRNKLVNSLKERQEADIGHHRNQVTKAQLSQHRLSSVIDQDKLDKLSLVSSRSVSDSEGSANGDVTKKVVPTTGPPSSLPKENQAIVPNNAIRPQFNNNFQQYDNHNRFQNNNQHFHHNQPFHPNNQFNYYNQNYYNDGGGGRGYYFDRGMRGGMRGNWRGNMRGSWDPSMGPNQAMRGNIRGRRPFQHFGGDESMMLQQHQMAPNSNVQKKEKKATWFKRAGVDDISSDESSRSRSRSRSRRRRSRSGRSWSTRSRSKSRSRSNSRRRRHRSRSGSRVNRSKENNDGTNGKNRSRSKSSNKEDKRNSQEKVKESPAKSRSRSKSNDRSANKDRSRSKSKNKSPSKSRDRTRSKSNDRSKDKSRSKSRDKSPAERKSRSKSPKSREPSRSKSNDRSFSKTDKESKSKDRSCSKSKDRSCSKSKDRSCSKSRDRSRSKSRGRSRSKSRGRSRSKSRGRSRSKSRGRSRSKSRGRSRSKSRGRSRSKSRGRSRSKSRGRSRSRSGSKSRSRHRGRSRSRSSSKSSRSRSHKKRSKKRNKDRGGSERESDLELSSESENGGIMEGMWPQEGGYFPPEMMGQGPPMFFQPQFPGGPGGFDGNFYGPAMNMNMGGMFRGNRGMQFNNRRPWIPRQRGGRPFGRWPNQGPAFNNRGGGNFNGNVIDQMPFDGGNGNFRGGHNQRGRGGSHQSRMGHDRMASDEFFHDKHSKDDMIDMSKRRMRDDRSLSPPHNRQRSPYRGKDRNMQEDLHRRKPRNAPVEERRYPESNMYNDERRRRNSGNEPSHQFSKNRLSHSPEIANRRARKVINVDDEELIVGKMYSDRMDSSTHRAIRKERQRDREMSRVEERRLKPNATVSPRKKEQIGARYYPEVDEHKRIRREEHILMESDDEKPVRKRMAGNDGERARRNRLPVNDGKRVRRMEVSDDERQRRNLIEISDDERPRRNRINISDDESPRKNRTEKIEKRKKRSMPAPPSPPAFAKRDRERTHKRNFDDMYNEMEEDENSSGGGSVKRKLLEDDSQKSESDSDGSLVESVGKNKKRKKHKKHSKKKDKKAKKKKKSKK